MADTVYNLITADMCKNGTSNGITYNWESGALHVSGTATSPAGIRSTVIENVNWKTNTKYSYSLDVVSGTMPDGCYISIYNNGEWLGKITPSNPVTFTTPSTIAKVPTSWGVIVQKGMTVDFKYRPMLNEGDPAAWAPAKGDTLTGGGYLHE